MSGAIISYPLLKDDKFLHGGYT